MALPVSQQSPTKPSSRQFIEYLITKNILKPGFRSVLRNRDLPQIDQYLVSKNIVRENQLPQLYADYYGIPFIELSSIGLNKEVARLIPRDIAQKYLVVAYDLRGKDIYIAIGRPAMLQSSAPEALLKLRQQKGLDIHLAITTRQEIMSGLDQAYGAKSPTAEPAAKTAANLPVRPVPPVRKEVLKESTDRIKSVNLTSMKIPPEILSRIPYNVAKKYQLVVFGSNMHRGEFEPPLIQIGVVNPNDMRVREILAYIEQKNKVLVDPYKIDVASLNSALAQYSIAPQAGQLPPATKQPTVKPVVIPAMGPDKPLPPLVAPPAPSSTESVEQGIVLTEKDIENKITNETKDLEGGDNPLENQNLDKLLDKPIVSPNELAQVIKGGVVPEVISALLFLAIRMKASDVHIEAQRNAVRFRYRIDGILHDIISAPSFLHAPLISRIKILSKMKIDEQRVPQDGRFDVTIDQRQVDLRVSTLPTVFGEKIVMRLLDKSAAVKSLEQLGITESNFDVLVENISKPYGIILSTGPTGSGKTTTLYAILNRISKPGVNIVTLEDPVEYELPGVNQAQVKPQIGFTFADGLRSVLRQDPNVIMVGEVRDLETAAMATHSALTGHLVLSTLHTNDAAGALPRLINMGVEPFLITSSINAVIGQRLVRKICDNCRGQTDIPQAVMTFIKNQLSELPSGQLKDIDLEQLTFYKGGGCDQCTNGYNGRIGIYEVLSMNDEIEELAVRKAPASDIKQAAIKNGMITMLQDGFIKALKGITTVDEVMRVTTASIKDAPAG
jgi:type IV pilus assembly protein PilB